MASLADRARVKLQPALYADAENGGILDAYLCGLVLPLQEVEDYAADSDAGPGWSVVLDLTRAPDKLMPWLSQFVGVDATVPIGQTPAQIRDAIAFRPNWKRGTPAALAAAIQPLLSGNKTVLIRERDTSPYHFSIFTYEAETPVAEWGTTNVVADPSIESGLTSGFVTHDGTLQAAPTRSPDAAWHGTQCLRGVALSASPYVYNGNGFAVVPGDYWSVSVYMMAQKNVQGHLICQVRDASSNVLISPESAYVTLPAWTWTRVGVSALIPANGVKILPLFQFASMTAGDIMYWDAFQVEKTSIPTPFVVGSRAQGTGNVDAAIRANKPAGLQYTYEVRRGQDYAALLARHPLYSNVFADYATYQGVVDDRPGT